MKKKPLTKLERQNVYTKAYQRGLARGYDVALGTGKRQTTINHHKYLAERGMHQFSCPINKTVLVAFKTICKRHGLVQREEVEQMFIEWLDDRKR
jgi:hypothetical protein